MENVTAITYTYGSLLGPSTQSFVEQFPRVLQTPANGKALCS